MKLSLAILTSAAVLLSLGSVGSAQSVNLVAQPATAILPDGQSVPMWGYSCQGVGAAPAACRAANPNAGAGWSPVVITTTPGSLTINLTNKLPVPPGAASGIPTSLVIVGQVGGGLGAPPKTVTSPTHATQGSTWSVANTPGATFKPPTQPDRVQSFGTEVPTGTSAAALTWSNLRPGTYLIESGTHPSIQAAMGLYGILVVTTPPGTGTAGTAYPGVTYSADVPLIMSEIDPVQNAAVAKAVSTTGFSETKVWSGQPGGCGNPATTDSGNCYPPVVNYSPLYYLINGVSLDRSNLSNSTFPTSPATGVTGSVLVRLVNAGLRMHVPSIVNATTGTPAQSGFSLIAEDGNPLPGLPRVQNEVFLAAGKTYDVMINTPPSTSTAALAIFDRQLSLSTNNQRDGGMQGYIGVNGSSAPAASQPAALAKDDKYVVVPGNPLAISSPGSGVIANDLGVYGVAVNANPKYGNLSLSPDGTFTYTPDATWTTAVSPTTIDTFTYVGNGNPAIKAVVTLTACTGACKGAPPTVKDLSYTSDIASRFHMGPPGVLIGATDSQGHPMTAAMTGALGGNVTVNADGSFTASPASAPKGNSTAVVTFTYTAKNSQGTTSQPATVSVTFNGGSGLAVNVLDAPVGHIGIGTQTATAAKISDYRWIIEEDRTFQVDPSKENTGPPTVQSEGTNFHTSYMPVVASGCVGTISCESGQTVFDPNKASPTYGQHVAAVCDIGDGQCRTNSGQQDPVDPSMVHLNPFKHYYISILPGDAGNTLGNGAGAPVSDANAPGGKRQFSIPTDCGAYTPGAANWAPATGLCGHGMGGAPIAPAQMTVNVLLQETPFQPAKISVFVYEDDFPLNGENDAGGGVDVLAPYEPGLSGFEIRLWDDAGGTGAATGQMTYDMFNMPLSNSLAGTKDPVTNQDACPITANKDGISGRIVTCPKYEADGKTLSPLAGQAIIANMMPGRYGVQANPGADRMARGEEWLQTNTLDGQKAHDSFIKVGGPAYFQEYGPAGFHVTIGFANPAIINNRLKGVCAGTDINVTGTNCHNTVTGTINGMRQSHSPDERLYPSGDNSALGFTQCYASLGDVDGEDFAFAKCDANGKFTISNVPDGDWRITTFDQWNDQIVDGLSTPVRLTNGQGYDFDKNGGLAVQQWHTNVATSTFFDKNGNGIRDKDEQGLALVPTNIRYRDGSYSNLNNTDLNGYAQFNEEFPLFNWYVIETDTTRYKPTGIHVVYDAGGPANKTKGSIAQNLAATKEITNLPTDLRFPGSVYCGDPDCTDVPTGTKAGPGASATTPSTGRVDPPWVKTEGWQGFIGQYEFLEFGKAPFAPTENGGIHGEVVYASTRPFDDPSLLAHAFWTPNVPGVTVNLYQETAATDGTTGLKLVDTTKTSSWDDWAQGFRSDGVPNMNCPGEVSGAGAADPFFFTLQNTPYYLDQYNFTFNGGKQHTIPYNSQFKCYDGLHNFNQVQPAPYDGIYKFPSVTSRDPKSGVETGTDCTICVANPTGDGTKMLPAGKYVVEMVTPPGYELVKEEDKNILIGDNFIAPVTQEFGSFGNVFILPDQAAVAASYNSNNAQNSTSDLGRSTPATSGDIAEGQETFWPCVGQARVVPDYISLFPGSKQVSPFAGATRNLCDRKEVTLSNQTSVMAKFWVFSSTHVAAHFTGFILDDLSAEFDPFSPQFGEKFAVANLPVSIKDHAGNEIERVYSDQWGIYNGLTYSTWEVNPPNPTGYAPTMMVACMNDPGNGITPDKYFNPAYSQFCYEIPYMPGQTQYMDTPIVPTSAFAEGYNPPDCSYPTATPAVASVIGNDAAGAVSGASGLGPWVSAAGTGHTLTINALGDRQVPNPAYTGPQATTAPYNQKFLTRHYGFGTQCTALGGSCTAVSSVAIGNVANAPIVSWSDSQIVVTVPAGVNGCPLQQMNAPAAQCGQLVITAGNSQRSIDAITVTIGGKAPTYVAAENTTNNAIQTALDNATPGDLVLVGPGTYLEMLLMWKPVRLQGVGAATTTINANPHPSGKMDPWRAQVSCLFGLAKNGSLLSQGNVFDATGQYSCPGNMQGAVDPLPLEGIVGWDTTLNGNLAQLLQEPSLMGAYEGAGVTVLAKGENMSIGQGALGGPGTEGDFPAGSRRLTNSAADCQAFPSNFWCNPSRIDGLTITNSSQGGGGVFAHAWTHNLEISNNRVYGNGGTLSGGLNIGQGESPDATFNLIGQQDGYAFEQNVQVHNNYITANTSYGDELFSASPAAAGGTTFCSGADLYHFNYNWLCGNLSTGDGGGLVHVGFILNGDISHNWILFNQTNNISVPTNGGGIAVLGAAPDGLTVTGLECGNTVADADCAPGLSDGTGRSLTIDSNVIIGNTAESGSGGGIRLQTINGTDVVRMPILSEWWNSVTVTNNLIANNVAGWDGGGISLQDALNVYIINNTIVSNDTTASSGVLFNTIGAPLVSTPGPANVFKSTPQPAGLVTMQNTANLAGQIPKTVLCPLGHPNCRVISYPVLMNNLFWQNRAFNISVGNPGAGNLSQQNLVSLLPTVTQSATGQCASGTNFWDIGIRGDTGPTDHSSTYTLAPTYSIMTSTAGYDSSNIAANPNVASQYCNGSRTPPELNGTSNPMGYTVPPGIADATVPNPPFNLTPAATVDEGNNWINMAYGPLSLSNPTVAPAAVPGSTGTANGDYRLTSNSPAIGAIKPLQAPLNWTLAPANDLLGNPRKNGGSAVDIGAFQYVTPPYPIVTVAPTTLAFGNVGVGTTTSAKNLTLTNTGGSSLTGLTLAFSTPMYARAAGAAGGTCTTSLAAGANCTIGVVFTPSASGPDNGTLTLTGSAPISGSPVQLTGTGAAATFTASVTPTSLAFPNTIVGSTSAALTLTVTNTGSGALAGGAFTFGGGTPQPFSRSTTSPGTCGATLGVGANCTVNVVFAPGTATAFSRTLTVAYTGATVTPASVTLTGTGLASVTTATLTPTTWSPSETRTCPGNFLQAIACAAGPTQTFTLTNTGNVQMTGIAQGVLGGTSPADYAIVPFLSSCGPAGGGQLVSTTTLTPGATCAVTVQFKARLVDPANSVRNATISITDSFGTQSAILTGLAK